MTANFEDRRVRPLSDDELDAVLSAAENELLGYVRVAAHPEAALLKIMAIGDNDVVPSEMPSPRRSPASVSGNEMHEHTWRVRAVVAAVIIFVLGFCVPRSAGPAPLPSEGAATSAVTLRQGQALRQFREEVAQSPWVSISFQIFFAPDQYDLSPAAKTQLSVLVAAFRIWPASHVAISTFVGGHPVSDDSSALADKRTKALRNWLITAGVSPGRLLATTALEVPLQSARHLSNALATVSVVPDEALRCVRVTAECPP